MAHQERDEKKGLTRFTLCGVQGCCPTVEVKDNEDEVIITDDNGGRVQLTRAEWKDAAAEVQV